MTRPPRSGKAVIIACTLVMPNDAASAANAWNAFTCAARSGIIVRRCRSRYSAYSCASPVRRPSAPAEQSTRRIGLGVGHAERAQRGRIEDEAVAVQAVSISGRSGVSGSSVARVARGSSSTVAPISPTIHFPGGDASAAFRIRAITSSSVGSCSTAGGPSSRVRGHRAGCAWASLQSGDQQPAAGVDRPRGARCLDLRGRPDRLDAIASGC